MNHVPDVDAMRLLVVDQANALAPLTNHLAAADFDVPFASDVPSAFERTASNQYDLLLIDGRGTNPHDDLQILSLLEGLPRKTDVIVLSRSMQRDSALACCLMTGDPGLTDVAAAIVRLMGKSCPI